MPLTDGVELPEIASRLTKEVLQANNLQQGVFRGWRYISRSEKTLPEIIDNAAVALRTVARAPNSPAFLTLSTGTTVVLRCERVHRTILGFLTPRTHDRHAIAFTGAASLTAAGLPVLAPYALLSRGGLLSPLESVLVFKRDPSYQPLPEIVKQFTDTPDIRSRALWKAVGRELGRTHQKQAILGLNSPCQIWVKPSADGPAVLFEVGSAFQVNSVLRYLREAEDMTGANFIFSPTIAPADRLRFLRAYEQERPLSDTEEKETIALVADLTRHKAVRELKIYQSDIPKKTTYLNLIRALDSRFEQSTNV